MESGKYVYLTPIDDEMADQMDKATKFIKTTSDAKAAADYVFIMKYHLKAEPPEYWTELVKGTCLEPQAVANIPVTNKFQPLAESMELSSDAQFPTAGIATPDAPFPEVSSDARSQEGSMVVPAAKRIKFHGQLHDKCPRRLSIL
ncbi:hypothetical protein JTE90_003376 [Oedothorax gibbosus]|uniref:Uncharacterized protein n=1 Tax=Oedothorax gibbosus TaxID=931172 RepID=A0AAV6TXH2_9ARAC|nr:hypothetical protein JTE90_003376 [Oedothorax gibbosus]